VSGSEDDELVTVLGQSIIGAARVLRDGKPQPALDMIEIVLMGLPSYGAEVIELAALPTKIIALTQLGRPDLARQVLARMESLAASHGGTDEQRACQLLREQLLAPDLTSRANAAMESLKEGRVENVNVLEGIAAEAESTGQLVIAIGALVFLGSVYRTAKPGEAHERLSRAKRILETEKPLDDARHELALGEIDRLLAELDSQTS